MDRMSARARQLYAELKALERRLPLYPRAWKDDVERRVALTGLDVLDVVYALKEERGFVSPQPVTIDSLLEDEKRFSTLFEPDELQSEPDEVPAVHSSAD
jgi:hypothetical protein